MTPLERLRLGVALGHAVVGADVRLSTATGDVLVVSAHPASDADPCAMRRVIAAAVRWGRSPVSQRVVAVEVGGSLEDLGGGVYRTVRDGVEQRWLASLLQPDRVARLLADLDHDGGDGLHARLSPDPCLGVTLVLVTATDPVAARRLDHVAAEAAAAVFVEELSAAVATDTANGDRAVAPARDTRNAQ